MAARDFAKGAQDAGAHRGRRFSVRNFLMRSRVPAALTAPLCPGAVARVQVERGPGSQGHHQ